jgi:hypothetical protein
VPEDSRFEPYVVRRRLADGTTSELWLARHEQLGRDVWIKALAPCVPLGSSFARALEREATLLARLSHDNVQGVLGLVRDGGSTWVVLEAVDGWTLSEVLEAARRAAGDGGLDVRMATAVLLQLARGLSEVHAAGLVHAAVQPRNVLVSRRGGCKLSGFSAAFERGEPAPPSELGDAAERLVAAYASPEHVLGEDPSPASDVFSLGVVAYELLTLELPWSAPESVDTPRDIRHSTPPPIARASREVPAALERVVGRCLEKRADQRFETAGDLLRALEELLGSEALVDATGAVARGLESLGFDVPRRAASALETEREARRKGARRGLERSLIGLGATCLVLIAGGTLLSRWLERSRPAGIEPQAVTAAPELRAGLLVLADPWAHVYVDGHQRATTPFATPIELPPGVHHLRLEHPTAPVERRRVVLEAGQTLLVDVVLEPRGLMLDAGAPLLAPTPDAGPPTP